MDGSAGGEKDSVWEITGSNNLSRARQAKSSSQSIHFFSPVSVLKVHVKAPLWIFGVRMSISGDGGCLSHGPIEEVKASAGSQSAGTTLHQGSDVESSPGHMFMSGRIAIA